MTDEVAELVLKDNYHQTMAISVATFHATYHVELYGVILTNKSVAD